MCLVVFSGGQRPATRHPRLTPCTAFANPTSCTSATPGSPRTPRPHTDFRDWCRADVIGEWSLPTATVSAKVPRMSPREAAAQGAGSLVIGIAPVGGRLPEAWLPDLLAAIECRTRRGERPAHAAQVVSGARCRGRRRMAWRCNDVRHADRAFPAGTGRKRTGMRVATVGTDCALGKKYTALALTSALRARGAKATFRATGQTGIMIAGEGIAIDAVVADFIAGAAETLSPDNAADHWDVIEGQGSLFHPAYAGVTLGLLHGSQPDAFVLCHDPSRKTIEYFPDFPIPALGDAVAQYTTAGRVTNRAIRCVGVSINSSTLSDVAWHDYSARVEGELGVPVCDPMRGGVDAIAKLLVGLTPAAS